MEKKEYLNLITKEINNNRKKLEEVNNSIIFYKNINDIEKLKELENNKVLYEKRIEMFSEIEKLPIYLQLKKCDSTDLEKYNEKLMFDLINELKIISNKISSKENIIQDFNKDINELYLLYKTTNDSKYEEQAKNILNDIKVYKEHIENLKNRENDLKWLINKLKETNGENLINKLMIKYGISSSDMENILNNNIPKEIDKLAVPICNNLDILNTIKEYCDIDKENISVPFNSKDLFVDKNFSSDYLETLKFIQSYIGSDNIDIYNQIDLDKLNSKIEMDLGKIDSDKTLLDHYFNILNSFPKDINNYDLANLKQLTFKTLINEHDDYKINLINEVEELSKLLNEIEEKQIKLNNRQIKTKNVIEKIELLNYKYQMLMQEALDAIWNGISNDIYKAIENVNHSVEFKNSLISIDDYNSTNSYLDEDKNVIETYRYNNLNLLGLKKLMKYIFNIYEKTSNELKILLERKNTSKVELIKLTEEKETKLKEIEEKINSMYRKVSDLRLNTSDYYHILNMFKDNNIIDSIVKLEREELINIVKKNSYKVNMIEELINEKIEISNETNEEIVENNIEEDTKKAFTESETKGNNDVKEENKTTEEPEEEKKETVKKLKISKEDLEKIKKFIIDLGIDYNRLKTLITSIINNDELLDNILNTSNIEELKKNNIKYAIKNINLDSYSNISDLVVDLTVKYELDLNTLKQLGKDILKNRSVIFNIIKSNKNVLFNVLKSDVLKKILKK